MTGFSVTIKEIFSRRELSYKERVIIKDTTAADGIDQIVTDTTPLDIHLSHFAMLDVHNESSKDKDYTQVVLVDEDGNRYFSGSDSLMSALLDIWAEMRNCPEDEDWQLRIYKLPSKNYSGKSFLTCTVI